MTLQQQPLNAADLAGDYIVSSWAETDGLGAIPLKCTKKKTPGWCDVSAEKSVRSNCGIGVL